MPYDDTPEKDTPAAIRKMLAEYGGRAPNGGAAWRLVLAQNCRAQCFGIRRHAPQVADTSELDLRVVAPERVEEGSFWVQRYKCKGWILQKWFPPTAWGSREDWEREKSEDGITRLRAKYPENGDYFMMAGPWRAIEDAGDLITEIQRCNRAQMKNPVSWDRYFADELRKDKQEREEEIRQYETTLEIYRKTQLLPVLKSASQAAQRVRNQIQASMGSSMHLGASEMWGS